MTVTIELINLGNKAGDGKGDKARPGGEKINNSLTNLKTAVDAIEDGTTYIKADGTVPLTANWDVNGFNITGVPEIYSNTTYFNFGTGTSGTDAFFDMTTLFGGSFALHVNGTVVMNYLGGGNWELNVPTINYENLDARKDILVGGTVIGATVGIVKEVLDTGDSLTVPTDHQLLVHELYNIEGNLTIEGSLVIL